MYIRAESDEGDDDDEHDQLAGPFLGVMPRGKLAATTVRQNLDNVANV